MQRYGGVSQLGLPGKRDADRGGMIRALFSEHVAGRLGMTGVEEKRIDRPGGPRFSIPTGKIKFLAHIVHGAHVYAHNHTRNDREENT